MTVKSREYEYNFLKNKILNFMAHKQSDILHITGVPGSGKTYTIQSVIDDIKFTNSVDTEFIYINCNEIKNKRGIFYVIYNRIKTYKIKKPKRVQMQKKKVCYYEKCKDTLTKENKSYVIVLDEIDLLTTKNQDILYTLTNLPFFDNIQLFFISISNSFTLDSKVASRIGNNKITFKPYKTEQLMNILDCDTDASKYIAKRIGAVSGDVRRAINLNKECKKMKITDVENHIRVKSKQLSHYYLPNLSQYHKLFLLLYIKNTKIDENYEEFCSACKIRNLEELEYLEFVKMIEYMSKLGFIELKHGVIIFYLLQDEIENILKDDITYKKLKIQK